MKDLVENNMASAFLSNAIERFEILKDISEKAFAQIKNDEKLFWQPDNESNSIAIIVKHLTGNMRSRWTNIFTEDGEKKDRNRPGEFDRTYHPSRAEMLDLWNHGWQILFNTLHSLSKEDLMRIIYIRKEPHTVMDAILRQLSHYSIHVGQILFLAKHIEWKTWKHLTLPRDAEVFDFKEIGKK